MENELNIKEIIDYIDPSILDYQEWVNVGMALKHEGFDCSVWDEWSRRDLGRYHNNECYTKWQSFNGSTSPVTGGTIVQMAQEQGWKPEAQNYELDWNDEIGKKSDLQIISKEWVEGVEINEPKQWNQKKEIITYIETLFDSTENVGYVTQSWEKDGKYLPTKGNYDRTAGELIEALNKCENINDVIGDYNEECGAWIRFNPLDGKGVKNENVTDFRYALVESDNMDIEKQNAIMRELELPIATLTYSGKKSIHAIVRIDAINYDEYRKRVDYLYSVCKKNGLLCDTQNKNPSRLSRMPGIMRNGKKQFLIDTNIGKADFADWKEYIDSITDDLPDEDNLADVFDNLPELSPPLIDGVLRQGHKMLIAGPSKAGKSFALIELCIAIAEGKKWFGFDCTKGKIMYVNLELDKASCLHRFKDVYTALNIKPENVKNIDIWNLRGHSVPMDKLAPKMIRRAKKKNYIAIVIDPIYKIITGDENSADQMAKFCNQFDLVCTELGCAVIYCHHHSKGSQGGKKSMDRASGSGVFARDPDALLDMVELELTDAVIEQEQNKITCKIGQEWLKRFNKYDLSQDDALKAKAVLQAAHTSLSENTYKLMMQEINSAKSNVISKTAWRVDGTLREFPKFRPLNFWFDYPVHIQDDTQILKDVELENSKGSPWKSNFSKKKTSEERKKEQDDSIETAFDATSMGNNSINISELANYLGVTEKTVRGRLKSHGGFWIDDGKTGKK